MAPFKSPGLEFAGKIVGLFLILPKLQLGVMEHLNSGNRFNGLPWVHMNKKRSPCGVELDWLKTHKPLKRFRKTYVLP